ncbi:hypothetical protein SFOMI_1349 [Sphingobium fuliginis]|uniref:Uncharacterized protein n=1 Tax=Sphingobium fuliginis (strain ATCC 27551) TaxID=336203 RepID=A0A292ZD95_SPHSA|nr:hypothetical protein SFOMI_1349 [Sphingobium fuliginis]
MGHVHLWTLPKTHCLCFLPSPIAAPPMVCTESHIRIQYDRLSI